MNDLTTGDQAGTLTTIEQAADALAHRAIFGNREQFDIEKMIEQGCSVEHADLAKGRIRAMLVPMEKGDIKNKPDRMIALRDALGKIGQRIRPEMHGDAAKRWVASQVDAIRELPIEIAIPAADKANRDPDLQHPGQVQSVILREAKSIRHKYEHAMWRCDEIIAGIRNPQKRIEKEPPPPMDQEMIDGMARTEVGSMLIRMGVNRGFLVEDASTESGYRLADDFEVDDGEE